MAAPQRLVLELSAGCQLWLSKPWNTHAERTRRPNTILWCFSIRRIARDVNLMVHAVSLLLYGRHSAQQVTYGSDLGGA